MGESSAPQGGREKARSWISGKPLLSVAIAGVIGFSMGSASSSTPTTQAAAVTGVSNSDVAAAETETAQAMAAAELAESDAQLAEAAKAALQSKLSVTVRELTGLRHRVASLTSKLANARSAQGSVAAPAAADTTDECDPNYTGTCVPIVSYDLNCDDISGSVTVVGSDPHGFDGDGDGHGCE